MSIDLFVYRPTSDITSDELQSACRDIAIRFPGVLIDTEWNATGNEVFPYSEAFFWQIERASVQLAVPPNAEVFEVQGRRSDCLAYTHICGKSGQFDFIEFLAQALAMELKAELFDPQSGIIVPVSLPSLDSLRDLHEVDLRQLSPRLKKEYRWILLQDGPTQSGNNLELSAEKFNRDLTASVRAILDPAFPGLRVTRNTFSDLSVGLRLFASFSSNNKVNVLLTGELDREALFDNFSRDLDARFGVACRMRVRYVFA